MKWYYYFAMFKLPVNVESMIFLEDYQKPEAYIPMIVGVLNKCGSGALYIGVNSLGEAIGAAHLKSIATKIADDIANNIVPKIYPSIAPLHENKNVLKVSFEGIEKPYNYKGKYYLKDYMDVRLLDHESITKELSFIDKSHFIEDDEISIPFRNIDEQLVRKTYDKAIANKKYVTKSKAFVFKKILLNWGLVKKNKLTKASLLLYGKKMPLSLTANFYNNEKNTSVVETKFIKGNIISLLDFVLPYLKKTYCEKFRIKNNAYPEDQIKEIIVNAFLHANYNYGNEFTINISPYKISVLSPGNFPNEYYPEDFAITHARPIINNKIIGKILSYEGLATLNGSGFKKILEKKKDTKPYAMKQNGSLFEFTYFIYTDKNKYLTIDKAVLSILVEKPFAKSEDIAKKIGKTRRTVQSILKELKEKNLIVRKGSKKTGYWIVNK